jgi:hypothetical protein
MHLLHKAACALTAHGCARDRFVVSASLFVKPPAGLQDEGAGACCLARHGCVLRPASDTALSEVWYRGMSLHSWA